MENVDINMFSPTEPLGLIILTLGILFSSMIFYIIYAVSTNKESIDDKRIRDKKNSIQKQKIDRLFPNKK